MKQRWAIFLMGVWLCGMLISSVVATENFFTIDRLLAASGNAPFAAQVDRLGRAEAREFLRYLSSELNRLYFWLWNFAQLALGFVVLWLIWGALTAVVRWGVVGMLAVVASLILWLTPAITSLGRSLDFVPRDPPPPAMSRFWFLHAAYTSLTVINFVVGIIITVFLIRIRSSPQIGEPPARPARLP